MAWSGSTLHEFVNTSGQQHPCTAVSPAWRHKCKQPPADSKLFEAMAPGQSPCLQRDHVLLHSAAKISDKDVKDLSAAAEQWNSLIRGEPDMQFYKVLATDLLCKAEVELVQELRPIMIQRRFAPSEHISLAVERYRYEDMPEHRRAALGECLQTLCANRGITLDQLYQFETLAQWAQQRNSCFHPLGHSVLRLNPDAVAEACTVVTNNQDFNDVRDSALLLVSILEARLPAAS